jgi:hypothetical protein
MRLARGVDNPYWLHYPPRITCGKGIFREQSRPTGSSLQQYNAQMTITLGMRVAGHPLNQPIFNALRPPAGKALLNPSCSPQDYDNGEFSKRFIPEVTFLWRRLVNELPDARAWTLYGSPALIHCRSGVIFAISMGVARFAFRLPSDFLRTALDEGGTQQVRFNHLHIDLPGTWVVMPLPEERPEWWKRAYLAASQ